MAGEVIRVVGIPDLQRALRQIDRELPSGLASGLAEGAEIVVAAAKPTVPWLTGRARGSITARKRHRTATLEMGGPTAPYYPWLEFGGRVGRGGSVRRETVRGGRYIYPAFADKEDKVNASIDEVLERLARRAGFDQSGRSDRG